MAWAFFLEAATPLTADGRIGLLLPAMGILLNHSQEAIVCTATLDSGNVKNHSNHLTLPMSAFQLFDGAKSTNSFLHLYGLHQEIRQGLRI